MHRQPMYRFIHVWLIDLFVLAAENLSWNDQHCVLD